MTANDMYKMLVKFRRVGFEICGRTEMQTDKQTYIQTDRQTGWTILSQVTADLSRED